MARHVIARVGEIAPGERKLVELGGRPIVVFNLEGAFFALANRCPHQGGSLYHGEQSGCLEASEPGRYRYARAGEFIRCPWHSWEFDIRTGRAVCDPERTLARRYAASVVAGSVLLDERPAAETFEVRVEEDYVVIDL